MILFAAIIFLYELIQIRPCGYIDEVWKKNFGFLYGVGGKCCFIIFMGIQIKFIYWFVKTKVVDILK